MKKLAVIALALVTFTGFAQQKGQKKMDKENRSELRKEMSPKDIADLKSKKLTLKLDLTDVQQTKVHQIILKQAEENQKLRAEQKDATDDKKERASKDERIKRKNDKLDQMIELKREMKTILTAEQYAKFEKMKPRQQQKKGKHRGKHSQKDNKNQ